MPSGARSLEGMVEMPMFPLGSVLFPGALGPLRVFEPRYLSLVEDVVANGDPFGMVLIERGFEVGGGDARFAVGTVARAAAIGELEEGHIGLVVRGGTRFSVDEWLEDDPYPKAKVAPLDDEVGFSPEIDRAHTAVRQSLALLSELGEASILDVEVPDDPVLASWALAQVCPVGPLDHQELLEAPDAAIRLHRTMEMADEQSALARVRLAGG